MRSTDSIRHRPPSGLRYVRDVLYLMIAVTVTAHADARGLRGQLGDSCLHVAQVEVQLGARPQYDLARMLHTGILLFADQDSSGEHTEVLYRCSVGEGAVSGYSITVSTPDQARARSIYRRSNLTMQVQYGASSYDSESLDLLQRIRLWSIYRNLYSVREVSAWTATALRNVSVVLDRPRKGSDWQIVATDLPAAPPPDPSPAGSRLLAAAALLAVSSAAVVAALVMTPLYRLRWLIALLAPLALTYEAHGTVRVGAEAFAFSAASFAAALAASLLILWLVRPDVVSRASPDPSTGSSATSLLLLGAAALGILFIYVWWLFRPGTDPYALGGGFTGLMFLAGLGLPLATSLTTVGTARTLDRLPSEGLRVPYAAIGLSVAGTVVSVVAITLCINAVVEIVLGM